MCQKVLSLYLIYPKRCFFICSKKKLVNVTLLIVTPQLLIFHVRMKHEMITNCASVFFFVLLRENFSVLGRTWVLIYEFSFFGKQNWIFLFSLFKRIFFPCSYIVYLCFLGWDFFLMYCQRLWPTIWHYICIKWVHMSCWMVWPP